MTSQVPVALFAYFYHQSGQVFSVPLVEGETVREFAKRAVEKQKATSNQTQRVCFAKFEVRYGDFFINLDQMMKDIMAFGDDVFFIHNVETVSTYEKKCVGVPLTIYIKGGRGSRLKSGFYPIYGGLTVKQMKHYIINMSMGMQGYTDCNFWHRDGLLTCNSKHCKTVLTQLDTLIISSCHVNVSSPPNSAIMVASAWQPCDEDFVAPNPSEFPPTFVPNVGDKFLHGSSDEESNDSEDSDFSNDVARVEEYFTMDDFFSPVILDPSYLNDATDFDTDIASKDVQLIRIGIVEFKGRELFQLMAVGFLCIQDIKHMIEMKIADLGLTSARSLRAENFDLCDGTLKPFDIDTKIEDIIEEGEDDIILVVKLKFRGGGVRRTVKKSNKDEKVGKMVSKMHEVMALGVDESRFPTLHPNNIKEDTIPSMVATMNLQQLQSLVAKADEFKGTHQDRLIKAFASVFVPEMETMKGQVEKLTNSMDAIETGISLAFVKAYYDTKYDMSEFWALVQSRIDGLQGNVAMNQMRSQIEAQFNARLQQEREQLRTQMMAELQQGGAYPASSSDTHMG